MTCFLFIIIGSGFGHITRGLAVARQIRKKNSESKILMFTTTKAENLLKQNGFFCYSLPALQDMKPPMNAYHYNQCMGNTLKKIMDENHVTGIIFDGAFPYNCIVELLQAKRDILRIWLKREGDRLSYDQGPLNFYKRFFDWVIIPDEVGSLTHRQYDKNELLSPPIMFLEREEAKSRSRFCIEYNIPENDTIWYVQLPEWDPYYHVNLQFNILKELLFLENTHILVASTNRSDSYQLHEASIYYMNEYPNSIAFDSIDFAITSAGYNTVHELVYFHVPSILIPNKTVIKDDQLARARRVEALGGAIVVSNLNHLKQQINEFIRQGPRVKQSLEECHIENGAAMVAEFILSKLRERK